MSDIAIAPDNVRLGNVLGQTFAIFSRRLVPVLAVTAAANIPSYLAQFLLWPPRSGFDAVAVSETLFEIFLGIVTSTLASGMVIYGVIQELRGRRFTAGGSFGVVLARLPVVLGVAVVTALLIGLSAIALVVPAVILTCMWYVAVPACIAERTGVLQSMPRSRALTRGYRWRIFGIVVLLPIAALIVTMLVALALLAVKAGPGVLLIFQLAGSTIVGAFGAVISAVFYYELRVAHDGVDIDKIASVFD